MIKLLKGIITFALAACLFTVLAVTIIWAFDLLLGLSTEDEVIQATNTPIIESFMAEPNTPTPSNSVGWDICVTLSQYEHVVSSLTNDRPIFAPTDEGVWDYSWEFVDLWNARALMATIDNNGCIQQVGAITFYNYEHGDPGAAGRLLGTLALFSPGADGNDWVLDLMDNYCINGTGEFLYYTSLDGAMWEFACSSDLVNKECSTIISLYPPGW